MIVLKIMNVNDSDLFNVPMREKEISIGRSRSCEIRLDDHRISSKHICFFLKDSILYCRDLNSTNGTFVNNQKINPKENIVITERDEVKIGGSVIKIDLRFL